VILQCILFWLVFCIEFGGYIVLSVIGLHICRQQACSTRMQEASVILCLQVTNICVDLQGKRLAFDKLRAMIGMFHDGGENSKILRNVAAGSERAGFSGPPIDCGNVDLFRANEAHSSMAGFWFDYYAIQNRARKSCLSISNFTSWKIFQYAVYGEFARSLRVEISDIVVSDAVIGLHIKLFGADALEHALLNQTVGIQDSLFVGFSRNGNCPAMPKLLYTCSHFMAYCDHLSAYAFFGENAWQVSLPT
jgi:hypothetical protein